jgi:hypothetical protein
MDSLVSMISSRLYNDLRRRDLITAIRKKMTDAQTFELDKMNLEKKIETKSFFNYST